MFSSTIKRKEILANLEFTHAAWNFSRLGKGCSNLYFTDFIQFVMEKKGEYSNLLNKINRTGILKWGRRGMVIDPVHLENKKLFRAIFKKDEDVKVVQQQLK